VPTFVYTAVDGTGKRIKGSLVGVSEQAVLSELESRRLLPIDVSPAREGFQLVKRRLSGRALGQSYQQLADLLRAGVPLLRGLRLLASRRSSKRLASVFSHLAERVAEGDALADAMGDRPESFPGVHVAMIRAGEKGGFLETVLDRLGKFVIGQAELRGKVMGNLIYPAFLLTFGVAILGVIFGFFVPKFEPVFERVEPLPAITRALFAFSDLVSVYGLWALGVVVAGVVALVRFSRHPRVQRALAVAQLRGPIVGPIVRSLATARLCRMLGTMLAGGVPILEALVISRKAAGNPVLEEAVEAATEKVRAGETLAEPLGESGLIADDVVEMISVAEEAGNLDEVLVQIAETIEGQVDRLLQTAVRLIEPLLLMTIALAVAGVAAGLILPMMQLSSGI